MPEPGDEAELRRAAPAPGVRGLKRQCAAVTITVSEISVAVQKRVPATLSRPTPRKATASSASSNRRSGASAAAAPASASAGGERAERRGDAHAAPSAERRRPRPARRPVQKLGGMHHRHAVAEPICIMQPMLPAAITCGARSSSVATLRARSSREISGCSRL